MNVKIEQELNFVVDNDNRLFFDAQEAKKVSKRIQCFKAKEQIF